MSDRVQQVEAAFREATESDIAQFVELLPYSMDTAAADVRELVLAAVNRELMLEHERVARGEPVPWREGAPTGAEGLYLMELVPDWKPDCLPAREAWDNGPRQVLVQWYVHKGYCRVTGDPVYQSHVLRHRWLSE